MDKLAWKFWSFTAERVVEGLGAGPGGLTFEEARRRLALYGRNHLKLRFLTFGALLFLLDANAEQFRTGWFLESVMTELLILPVIRTWRPFYQSRPGKPLWVATVIVLAVALALPYLPLNKWLGFSPLPVSFILVFTAITGGYLIASEMTKKFFYRRAQY